MEPICGAFESTALKRIVLPCSLKELGYQTFEDCLYLEDIIFLGNTRFIGNAGSIGYAGDPFSNYKRIFSVPFRRLPARIYAYYGTPVQQFADKYGIYIPLDECGGFYAENFDFSLVAPVTLYAPDGRIFTAPAFDVPRWTAVGWYDHPVKSVTLYAPDGRTLAVPVNDVSLWTAVGWFEEPV